jgi:SSS family solute:Na+ symporter
MPLVYLLSLSGFHAIQDKRKRPRTIFLQAERCLGGRSERLLLLQTFRLNKLLVSQGQGFVVGLAIAAYEWQAAIVLLLVAKYFLPIFLKREIYTMPQFLQTRYGTGVKTLMSFYWIVLYTAVNLTAVLWLGGLAIESLTGP